MFERFTERARKTIVLAQEEARRMEHNYIGTEHLLLGLLKEDEGVAARVLKAVNVSLDSARAQVESIVGYGEEGSGGQAPFTPRSKKAFELALREAMQLGHDYIGTEHVLLGLLRESEGVAALAFRNLRVKPDDVRREIIRRLGEASESDTMDLIESEMAAENVDVFRARASGIEVKTNSESSETQQKSIECFVLELDYSYCISDDRPLGMDHEGLIKTAVEALGEQEHQFLEAGVAYVGGRILNEFPNIIELTVGVSAPESSPVLVSATVGW